MFFVLFIRNTRQKSGGLVGAFIIHTIHNKSSEVIKAIHWSYLETVSKIATWTAGSQPP